MSTEKNKLKDLKVIKYIDKYGKMSEDKPRSYHEGSERVELDDGRYGYRDKKGNIRDGVYKMDRGLDIQ
jgi:hypothetical protein